MRRMTATQPAVIAEGERVRIREKQIEDAERDYAWRSDPELASYDAARPISISYRSFLAALADELEYPTIQRRTFAIEDRETGAHIGNVMYYGYDPRRHEAELGITIGDREFWSRGYGAETVALVRDHLFGELGLQRVYLHTLVWNYRAQAAFARAGFNEVRRVERSGHDFVLMESIQEQPDG
jgi:RimJ/RimL family protein N-acetyltransferase